MDEQFAKKLFDFTKKELIKHLGKHALTDVEVSDMGKKMFGKKYIGTYPVDRVPLSKNGYMIINTDKYGNPGIHWVGGIKKGHTFYIYDSFGRKGSKILKPLTDKLKLKGIKIVNSDLDNEQRGKSEVCGHLCLSWLYVAHELGINYALLI